MRRDPLPWLSCLPIRRPGGNLGAGAEGPNPGAVTDLKSGNQAGKNEPKDDGK
jgi:hypothetical protein